MASRKEQKEQARAARIEKEQGAAAKAQRTRRIQIFGGVIAVAVIVIVVAIVITSGGGNSSAPTTPGQTTKVVSAVNKELKGIPQSGTTLGNPKAKVTMMYFGDLECPICKEFTLDILPQFVQDQVRTGKVKVTYRSFCTATCGGNFSSAQTKKFFDSQQIAAYAAGKQNKFWQYAEIFYNEQKTEDTGYVTDSWLTGLAKQVTGLKLSTWQTDRTDPSLLDQVISDEAYASKASLPGTPSLIMMGPKGEELVDSGNYPSYSDLVTAIQTVS